MRSDAEKAEFRQAVQAYLIPSLLFLSTVVSAAGVFLVYHGYALGWILIALAAAVMSAMFVVLIRFQNQYRAKGILPGDGDHRPAPSGSPEGEGDRDLLRIR